MRGTLMVSVKVPFFLGLIPAHAGNTNAPAVFAPLSRAHPRACGEHARAWALTDASLGSSPRMRGTLGCFFPTPRFTRLIPAHAGNTVNAEHLAVPWEAHPRACGEHQALNDILPPISAHPRACGEHSGLSATTGRGNGSSPRMRGTLPSTICVQLMQGLIPAHAGNTRQPQTTLSRVRAHPRACGEHRRSRK